MNPTNPPHLTLLAGVLLAILQIPPTANAAPRQCYPPLPEIGRIHADRFDEPYWFGTNWVDPDVWVESWSGYALIREQSAVAPWVVPMVGASTNLQINPERGAFRMWYRPSWSSFSTGLGMGPGGLARLLTLVSSNETESVIYWSLAINSTGDELNLICEGQSGPTVCASASIAFVAGEWQLLTVGYTETNSALFVGPEQVGSGSGVASVPIEAAGSSALVIGSSLAGDDVAMGEFEEFAAFSGWNLLRSKGGHEFGLSEFWNIANYYSNRIGMAVLGPVGEEEELTLTPGGGTRPTGMEEEFGGGMFAPLVLSGADCITNGPVLLTNVTASMTTNGAGEPVTQVGFNVIGGTNGPFSLYRSKDVSAPWISTNWLWIQYVSPCDAVWLTNEPPLMAYYRIGPEKDSDGDLMLDSWEILNHLDVMHNDAALDPDGDGLSNYGEFIAHTDPHNLDSDYDGVCDGEEVYAAHSTNPMDADEVAHILLGSWRFDSDLVGLQLQAPITSSNLALVPGISGNAVSVNSTNPAWLTYACSNDCVANINLRRGSARFWFKGAWNSGTADIGSAGSQPRLIEVGSKGSADGWFALILDSGGTNVSLCTPTDGAGGYKTNYTVGINWNSNQYHQIVATWSPTNSSLYLDGVLRTNAAGIVTWPKSAARAGGFRIGSDSGGTNQAKGRFDNLETWNYELSAAEVAAGLSGCPPAVDVMLVIDRSSSMTQGWDGTNKFDAAKHAATNFVGHLRLDPDQAGLVSFWSNSFMYQGLTITRTSIVGAITSLISSNGTCMEAGIISAHAELTNQAHRNPASLGAIVLLTDGFNEGGTNSVVVSAAAAVTNAGMKMITVALGSDADGSLLKQIASTTNDFHWPTNQSQLDQAYNSIANTLCRLTNLPPSVSITNPTNNQSFTYPAGIRIEATASDPENGLVKVVFYGGTNGATLIGTDYHAPFTVVWSGAAVGTNVVRAVAYDEYGLTSTDLVSVVVISVPPTVQFVSPTNGQFFVFSPTNISIMATASVAGASITNLTVYNGAVLLGQTNGSVCQLLWTNVTGGTNALSAVAADSLNRRATNNIIITNNFLPAVSFLQPATNFAAYLEVTNVLLRATNYDRDGVVTNVVFYCHTNLPGIASSNSHVWSLSWSNLARGNYVVTAVATDNKGASNSSEIRVFRVNPTNISPPVWITYPASNAVLSAGVDLTITASVTNGSGTVTNVEFFVNDQSIGSDPSAPYAAMVYTLRPGKYSLLARAKDTLGASSVSAQVNITVVETPPLGTSYWDPNFYLPKADECGGEGERYWCFNGVLSSAVAGTNLYLSAHDYQYSSSVWRWDGTNWFRWGTTALGWDACQDFPFSGNEQVAVNDSKLYVAGSADFGYAVKRLDGTNWTQIGPAFEPGSGDHRLDDDPVTSPGLHFFAGDLYIHGNFVGVHTNGGSGINTNLQYIARWDAVGSNWVSVGTPLNGPVLTMAGLNGHLYIGGLFTNAAGNTNARHIAELVSGSWTNLGSGVTGTNYSILFLVDPDYFTDYTPVESGVFSLAVWGTNLIVGGDFSIAGHVTNAGGIALWNGKQWVAMGGGLQADYGELWGCDPKSYLNPVVRAVAVRGNDVYVGGSFSSALDNISGTVPAVSIAKASWVEGSQQWAWSDLDYGLYQRCSVSPFPRGTVSTLSLMDGPTPDSYDVVAGGIFTKAGAYLFGDSLFGLCDYRPYVNNRYKCLARWRVGFPAPAGPPLVTLTNPVNHAVFSNAPVSLLLEGRAVSGLTNMDKVDVLANGNAIGSSDVYPATNDYFFSFTASQALDVGPYLLKAVATDHENRQGESEPVLITIRGTNFFANDDSFSIVQGSPTVSLPVLTNDTAGVRVSQITQFNENLGRATRGHDGSYIWYTPWGNRFGTDRFAYVVTNSSGQSDFAWVTVNILPKPVVRITKPSDSFARTNLSAIVNLQANAFSYDFSRSITNIALFLSGTVIIQAASNSISTNWSTNAVGFYHFYATATDNQGLTNRSSLTTIAITNSPSTNIITASIDNLHAVDDGLGGTILTTVREGLFELQGQARDSNTNEPVSYELLLYRPQDEAGDSGDDEFDPFFGSAVFANVTPTPRDIAGFHPGRDDAGALGTLDLSGIPNGTYDLLLTVRGGGTEARDWVRFRLESNLKIGQFSFSEQDLVLPVNGIPLTVTRTYNSLNPRSADFGYSWTMALNTMDVELDDVRQDVTIGSPQAPFADDEEDEHGLPKVVSIRTGGGWDVTLNLPDGRRTTFAFTPFVGSFHAEAQWTPPPDVHATLRAYPPGSETIEYFPSLYWQAGGDNSTFENHDIPGWVLETLDGTKYFIERGDANKVVWDSTSAGNFVNVQAYGAPKLTRIVQRTGDWISITDDGVAHYNPSNHLTRSVLIDRDSQRRVTAIWDPISQISEVYPSVRYVYNQETGNLIQVLKLVNRETGAYLTNRYRYDNSNFPHYITSMENPLGIPVARNEYDDDGRLTSIVDADGNRTEYVHSTSNRVERVIDRMGFTNTMAYDFRGNVTARTNALNGITLMAHDDLNNRTNQIAFEGGQPYATNRWVYDPTNGLLLASYNPLGYSNVYTYNTYGQVVVSVDAGGNGATNEYDGTSGLLRSASDALGNTTTYKYNSLGLLVSSTGPLGAVTTNVYDGTGKLSATALLTIGLSGLPPGLIVAVLSTNSFAYDQNGNRTSSVAWRRANGDWVGATNRYVVDGLGRAVRTIAPNGGTNEVAYDAAGRLIQTIDPLGHVITFTYDGRGRLIQTTYPDLTTTVAAYDSNGRQTNSVDQLGRTNSYVLDGLGRQVAAIYADNSASGTVYDDLGRIRFSMDARGTTNAFGYDVAGNRLAATNALGTTVQFTNGFVFDANGKEILLVDAQGRSTTNVFDTLNRLVQVWYPDGTKTRTGYDAGGRRVAETNQDGVVMRFGYDGAGRLIAVTNGFSAAQATWALYEYDEAGNGTEQIDALNRTNRFAFDALGRRSSHTLPSGQTEGFGYDLVGNIIRHTNFSQAVITNVYDGLNREVARIYPDGTSNTFKYTKTGRREFMNDASGSYTNFYDSRDRLRTNVTPAGTLVYGYDSSGNQTSLTSSTAGGTLLTYQYDALNRLTNVVDGRLIGTQNTGYKYDVLGNLVTTRYPNGVTNLYQYDLLNRLTNLAWNLNGATLASFFYQLSATGTRTNLNEMLSGTNRAYAWSYDKLYRLTNEVFSGASPTGTVTYAFDKASNRTNRTGIGALTNLIPPTGYSYNSNDWLSTDVYDSNGNTVSNASHEQYCYNYENRLTYFNNGSVLITYNADGQRVRKVAGGVTNLYLVDTLNPTGYPQIIEELTNGAGSFDLARSYTYGTTLISQRLPGASTHFFGRDGHGSTRFLTDSSGAVAQTFAYDAYGVLVASNATPATTYLFCGGHFDADLGLYHFGQRYLSTGTGRFWTRDAFEGDLENPITQHRYLYCLADPVNNVDPTGNEVEAGLASMSGFGGFAGSPTASLSPSNDGHGGPDVTQALKNTLCAVEAWFKTLENYKKAVSAQEIRNPFKAGNAWDIKELFDITPDFNQIRSGGKTLVTGTGLFVGTVAVDEEVYYASAVNYAIYGKMSRLSYDFYKSIKDPFDCGLFSLSATKAWVKAYKRFAVPFAHFPSLPDTSYETGYMAEAFAAWGYDGTSLPKGMVTRASGDVVEGTFSWRWMPFHDHQ